MPFFGGTHQVNVAKVFSSLFVRAIIRLKIGNDLLLPFWRRRRIGWTWAGNVTSYLSFQRRIYPLLTHSSLQVFCASRAVYMNLFCFGARMATRRAFKHLCGLLCTTPRVVFPNGSPLFLHAFKFKLTGIKLEQKGELIFSKPL